MRPDEVREPRRPRRCPDGPAYETVGGYVMAALGRVPEVGDEVEMPGRRCCGWSGWTAAGSTGSGRCRGRRRCGRTRRERAVALLLAAALLLLNAFFVGAEFAVISARRSQIEPLAAQGRRSARTTLWAMEHVSLMLACAQLGITVCSLGLGAVAEPALADLLEGPFAAARVPEGLVHPVAFALALAVVVYLHVVVGEMVPKNLAIAGPERAALVLAPPLVARRAGGPPPWSSRWTPSRRLLLRLLRVEPKEELASAFTAEEVHSIVTESRREGLLDEEEHGLLTGALELGARPAGESWCRSTGSWRSRRRDARRRSSGSVARTGFSRFPVVRAADGADRRLPAPQGPALRRRHGLHRAGAEPARPGPGHASRPTRTPRRCWRPCSGPARTWPGSSITDGRTVGVRLPRGRARGARRARSATPPSALGDGLVNDPLTVR